jgi:hypothetical protein
MAHTTISPPSKSWSPAALLSAVRTRRILRALRPPWMLAVLLVTGTAVGVLALEVAELDLVRERDAQLATNEVLRDSAQTARQANAQTRIRTADLRLVLAEQADALSSTEGFLK